LIGPGAWREHWITGKGGGDSGQGDSGDGSDEELIEGFHNFRLSCGFSRGFLSIADTPALAVPLRNSWKRDGGIKGNSAAKRAD
jgi:hypothetical protein